MFYGGGTHYLRPTTSLARDGHWFLVRCRGCGSVALAASRPRRRRLARGSPRASRRRTRGRWDTFVCVSCSDSCVNHRHGRKKCTCDLVVAASRPSSATPPTSSRWGTTRRAARMRRERLQLARRRWWWPARLSGQLQQQYGRDARRAPPHPAVPQNLRCTRTRTLADAPKGARATRKHTG